MVLLPRPADLTGRTHMAKHTTHKNLQVPSVVAEAFEDRAKYLAMHQQRLGALGLFAVCRLGHAEAAELLAEFVKWMGKEAPPDWRPPKQK